VAVSDSISFTVPLVPPSVNGYVRHTKKGGHYVTAEAKAFKEAVALFARGKSVSAESYRVSVELFYGKGVRGDLDNRAKVTLDALVDAGVIHSDAAIRELNMKKHRDAGAKHSRTFITVEASRGIRERNGNEKRDSV
jgi:crossover junction endodeoxyribonuclease RusA